MYKRQIVYVPAAVGVQLTEPVVSLAPAAELGQEAVSVATPVLLLFFIVNDTVLAAAVDPPAFFTEAFILLVLLVDAAGTVTADTCKSGAFTYVMFVSGREAAVA